jgi:ubiquinol-cytochrome c reductase cytochrome c1 subunit
LKFVPYRSLSEEGGPHLDEDQMKAYAAQFDVYDADLDEDRSAKPTDYFGESGVEGAPDLSLMAKARAGFYGPYGTGINQLFKGMGGPEYIYSLLTGYTGEEKEEFGETYYENTAYPGGWIKMAPPLYGEDVDYIDGHANDLSSVSKDVSAFLMWTAEPKLIARKTAGFSAVAFLGVLAVLLFLTNKKLWAPIKRKDH